jgi:hypothetical protein
MSDTYSPRFRHWKHGCIYELVADHVFSDFEFECGRPHGEFVVYKRVQDGKNFMRPRSEFFGTVQCPNPSTCANAVHRYSDPESFSLTHDRFALVEP